MRNRLVGWIAVCCLGLLWSGSAAAESILIVDDDNDSPNVQAHFTTGLAQLGIPYDVYVVGTGSEDGPTAAILAEHPMVIWFSGSKVAATPYPGGDPEAGPNPSDEALLDEWLDAGGRLWLDSQSYIEDYTYIRPLLVDHIGVQSGVYLLTEVQTIYGDAGDPIGGLDLTTPVYDQIGARLASLGLPTLICQEGGYNTEVLGDCVLGLLRGFDNAHGSA